MLSDAYAAPVEGPAPASLNAPFGARCFLTSSISLVNSVLRAGLNAPFGARRFLTGITDHVGIVEAN